VISKGKDIIPLEVKAGKSGSLKSLQQMMLSKKLKKAFRFDLNLPSIQKVSHKLSGPLQEDAKISYSLSSLPLYFSHNLNSLLDKV